MAPLAPVDALVLRPRLQDPAECLRPTRAEVDLGAVAANFAVVAQAAAPARVVAIVKADGYGHGVVPVARRLEEAGGEALHGFGVALAEEALELREAGIRRAILVLNGAYGGAYADVLAAGLTPVVYDRGHLEGFARAARGRPFAVHLKVDTGMSRLGVSLGELDGFLTALDRTPGARVEGLMTHLMAADSDDAVTAEQLQRFTRAQHALRAHGHRPRLLHAANSAATFRHPSARYDLVRPGIALFGHAGSDDVSAPLRPALRLRSEVLALRDLRPGDRVGYDGTFTASRPTRLATLPIGYGDGLLRAASNRGFVLVRGRRCPLVGRVSMDLSTVDVTDVPGVAVGDEACFLGAQEGPDGVRGAIDMVELAEASGTAPYEVLCAISRRVPRFYR